jgi:hypothetical protein
VKITDKQGHIKMLRLIKILLLIFTAMPCTLYALDKKGNYESKDEQDKHIAATLKKMAVEMNSQAPITAFCKVVVASAVFFMPLFSMPVVPFLG